MFDLKRHFHFRFDCREIKWFSVDDCIRGVYRYRGVMSFVYTQTHIFVSLFLFACAYVRLMVETNITFCVTTPSSELINLLSIFPDASLFIVAESIWMWLKYYVHIWYIHLCSFLYLNIWIEIIFPHFGWHYRINHFVYITQNGVRLGKQDERVKKPEQHEKKLGKMESIRKYHSNNNSNNLHVFGEWLGLSSLFLFCCCCIFEFSIYVWVCVVFFPYSSTSFNCMLYSTLCKRCRILIHSK